MRSRNNIVLRLCGTVARMWLRQLYLSTLLCKVIGMAERAVKAEPAVTRHTRHGNSRASAGGNCEYGSLPGTLVEGENGLTWKIYDEKCALKQLVPYYLDLNHSAAAGALGQGR